MTPLWQWLTQRWGAHRRRTRAARLAHVLWHERWGERQAVSIPSRGDPWEGRCAEAMSLLRTAW